MSTASPAFRAGSPVVPIDENNVGLVGQYGWVEK